MTLDDIIQNWNTDSIIDETNIINETLKTTKLHHKYTTILAQEGLRILKYREDMKILKADKTRYYSGAMDVAEVKQRGWQPLQLKIIRQDVPLYLEADQDIVNLSLKIGQVEQKIKYLEDVVKCIHNRSFHIKNAVEWAKWQSGG